MINSKVVFKFKFGCVIISLLLPQIVFAQSDISPEATEQLTAAANPNLHANGFHRFLFGSAWRDVWDTPVKAGILKIDSSVSEFIFEKILTSNCEGSSLHSLILKDRDENEFIFIPLNQDSASSLPYELSSLLPQDIVADQVCTLNPYAPLVVSSILRAVNLPYRETRLFVLPGKIQAVNGGLGIIEGPLKIPPAIAKSLSLELCETDVMIKSVESSMLNHVDEFLYLKIRLIDILLGNWEHNLEQWLWLKDQNGPEIMWLPIPFIQRQAFTRLNGFLPTIADYAIPQLEDCGNNISNVENLTLTGRFLDRRLLTSYPKQIWDSLANWIQSCLSDSVLTQALSNLPTPIFEKESESLLFVLKSRRAQLPKATHEFYKLSSSFVDLNGSDRVELAKIRRLGRHMVSVELYDRSDSSSAPAFKRLFHDDFTKEIRIQLHGGDDIVSIEGEENSAIKIIIDGGEGCNDFTDKSRSKSLFGAVNPFSAGGTIYYDNNAESKIKSGSKTRVVRNTSQNLLGKNEQISKPYRDWGSEWSFSPWLDINPDDGLFIGGGPVYTEYAYKADPYSKQIGIRAGLATRTMRYRLDATGEFRDWFSGVRVFFQLHASQLDLSNFYGVGNETMYSQKLDNYGYYKVDQQQIFLHTALGFSLASNLTATIGGRIKLIDNNPKPGTLLHISSLPYYNKSLTFLNLNGRIQADTRDNEKLPKRGMFGSAEVSYLPKIFDNTGSFYKTKGEIRSYFTFFDEQSMTIACRVIGEKIWGEYPFFESAFLGGNESLRGFERQRFAGNASIMGGAELRTRLTQIPFIIPLWFGFSAFAETGRVFLDSEHSNRWHNVVGGGVWFSFIKPEYIANFSLAHSEDKFAFYATLGFMF